MPDPIRFPKNPNEGRENIFKDADGNNPFGDADAGDEQSTNPPDDPLSSPAHHDQQSYQPEYAEVLTDRRSLVFSLGLFGFILTSLACFVTWFDSSLICLSILFLICTLAANLTGWVLGRADLHAMRMGAMSSEGRSMTWYGTWMSILGIWLTIGYFVVGTAWIYLEGD